MSFFVPTFVVLIGILFALAQYIYTEHWYVKKFDTSAFIGPGIFKKAEIPITYYHKGHIHDVMSKWNEEFHLYRLQTGETLEVDAKKIFGDSKVRVKKASDICAWESTLCRPCFVYGDDVGVREVNVSQIFTESGFYASFAKIDVEIVDQLWKEMKIPFSIATTNIEHAFIGNFDKDMLTASIHANPVSSSMAIQFTGSKTWIFFSNEDYLAKDGFGAIPAAPIALPRRVPTRPVNMYVYHSRPGDILFFPECWAHIVWTHAGPNFMLNYRKVTAGNFLRQPITWITAMVNQFLLGDLQNSASKAQVGVNKLQSLSVPEKHMNNYAFGKMDSICTENGGHITPFDEQLLNLLHQAADENPYR